VAIIGAGPIGLLCQQAFQSLSSADVIVADLIPERLSAASRLGAKHSVDSQNDDFVQAILNLTGGEGVDVAVDAVGSELSKNQSLAATRPGGIAIWIGLHENSVTIKSHEVTLSERRVQGSYAASLSELKTAVELLESGRVEWASWIKTFPLANGVEAFHTMLAAQGDNIKAVLIPQG
jgi:L-iditol 2-dehydrogenase